MNRFLRAVLFVLLSTAGFAFANILPVAENLRKTSCASRRTCSECITADPLCGWCSQQDYDSVFPRCDDITTLFQRSCQESNVVAPYSAYSITKDLPLSHTSTTEGGKTTVQIKPQKIRLKLRPHEEKKFNISFRQAKNYPVDLYYLMDLTRSMQDDKEILAILGEKLVTTMRSITTNFRMGFGSFVDKVVMPYVDTHPPKLKNPCPDNYTCEAPYGFRNHMSLSNDTNEFVVKVKDARTSANLDDAEGGFDALMQVAVCKRNIRWDGESRKIVVFATDSGFHYAGDGKLGGIVKPNDEKCHLDNDGLYTQSSEQDYPSLSQINRIIQERKINLMFAVPKEVYPTYEKLSSAIEGASVSELNPDSSNIVDLISEQYEKIRSKVNLTDDAPPNVSLEYKSSCLGNKTIPTKYCGDLQTGDTVLFETTLRLDHCPPGKANWTRNITIYPIGLNDVLEIELQMICDCDCEQSEKKERKSKQCNGTGTYQCGICDCPEGRFGRNCECTNNDVSKDNNWGSCRPPNSTTPCSSRGDCVCGVCDCFQPADITKKIYGEHCQCDNFSCDRGDNGLICGGEDKGECECGRCECLKGWKGPTCGCSTITDTCQASDGSMCSDHGKCVCGRCECDTTQEGTFGGPYCEECPTCKGKCVEFRSCVECQAFGQGDFSQEDCKNCSFTPNVVDTLEGEHMVELSITFLKLIVYYRKPNRS
ncbi:hypothetical protein CHUAL_009784 [Chamberlinius hualienensis]